MFFFFDYRNTIIFLIGSFMLSLCVFGAEDVQDNGLDPQKEVKINFRIRCSDTCQLLYNGEVVKKEMSFKDAEQNYEAVQIMIAEFFGDEESVKRAEEAILLEGSEDKTLLERMMSATVIQCAKGSSTCYVQLNSSNYSNIPRIEIPNLIVEELKK